MLSLITTTNPIWPFAAFFVSDDPFAASGTTQSSSLTWPSCLHPLALLNCFI